MNRPKDLEARKQLLDRAVQYVLKHGVGGLSLRPMAQEIGTTARMLIHHFESKEALIAAVLLAIEQDFAQRTAAQLERNPGIRLTINGLWKETAAPALEPALRAMFELWGQALLDPRRYRSFLDSMAEPWIDLLRRRFEQSGRKPNEAAALATLAVGAFQGLQLIRLTSGNGARSEAALRMLLQWLEPGSGASPSRAKKKGSHRRDAL